MTTIIDALGRAVVLAGAPRRIVSLVPSLTEYLFAIGLGERVVGVTDFCIRPAAAVAGLPKVRGTKNPDRAAIRSLQPDLVLAAKEENRRRDIVSLEAMGIPVYVTDICSIGGALAQLTELARILDAEASAQPMLAELRATLERIEAARASQPSRPTLAFIWRDPWMAVGGDTYAHDLLRICGAQNLALQRGERYPRAELAEFMRLEPELILLPSEPYAFTRTDLAAFEPFSNVPAVRTGQIHLCDGELLTWYGPRTVQALRVFGELLAF